MPQSKGKRPDLQRRTATSQLVTIIHPPPKSYLATTLLLSNLQRFQRPRTHSTCPRASTTSSIFILSFDFLFSKQPPKCLRISGESSILTVAPELPCHASELHGKGIIILVSTPTSPSYITSQANYDALIAPSTRLVLAPEYLPRCSSALSPSTARSSGCLDYASEPSWRRQSDADSDISSPSLAPWAAQPPSSSHVSAHHTEPPSPAWVSPLWVSCVLTSLSRVRPTTRSAFESTCLPRIRRHCPRYYGWYHRYLRPRRLCPYLRRSDPEGLCLVYWFHPAGCWSGRRSGWSGCRFRHRHRR